MPIIFVISTFTVLEKEARNRIRRKVYGAMENLYPQSVPSPLVGKLAEISLFSTMGH